MNQNTLLRMTADIVAEYAATNSLSGAELPGLIHSTYQAFSTLGGAPDTPETDAGDRPAVSIRKSLADPNFIISMIDGKPYQILKTHLTRHGLTPSAYRERFGLKPDYPMTAPAYSERRSQLAKQLGLGRKVGEKPPPRKPVTKKKLTPSYR